MEVLVLLGRIRACGAAVPHADLMRTQRGVVPGHGETSG